MTRTASEALPSRTRPGGTEQRATRAAFFVAGLAMAAWAPLVPYAKLRLGAGEGELGLLLLCLGLGSVVSMPFAGGLAGRFGCRAVIVAGAIAAGIALPLLAGAPNAPMLAAGLLLFGAGVGTVDVTMNIQAVIVERASGRAMMSGFHGLFSVGGIAGAGGLTGLMALRLPPLAATLIVVAIGAAILAAFARGLLPYGDDGSDSGASPAFAWPRGKVLLFGALCFVLFLAEGSVLDWSGIFLTSIRGVDSVFSGLGYAAFAAAMTVGRLSGDMIVRRFGLRRILLFGGLIAASGIAVVVLVPHPAATILGFGLVGAGASNVVPVLFSAAGRQTAMPANLAIAAVTTMGYVGILAGPALIGFAAHAFGLPVALSFVAGLLVVVALSSRAAAET